jgi:hypothetical protein
MALSHRFPGLIDAIFSGGHPLILGRPWLATVDAYIGC